MPINSKRVEKSTEATPRPFVVAGYLRVSTEDQAESGLGLDAQRKQIRAQATLSGWDEQSIAWYVDDGVSGTIDIVDRDEGLRLVQDIHTGKVQAVIVSSIDRIGRKAIYVLSFIDDIKDRCNFASCKERIDTTTPVGIFMLQVLASIAELERNTIAQRTQQALEARGRSVGIKAGRPPFGYAYDEKDVLVNEGKADIVRLIFSLRKQDLSLRKIAEAIETEKGVHVGFKTVQEILQNEAAYRGGKRGESAETWPIILENAA